jgi:hypothetical protein
VFHGTPALLLHLSRRAISRALADHCQDSLVPVIRHAQLQPAMGCQGESTVSHQPQHRQASAARHGETQYRVLLASDGPYHGIRANHEQTRGAVPRSAVLRRPPGAQVIPVARSRRPGENRVRKVSHLPDRFGVVGRHEGLQARTGDQPLPLSLSAGGTGPLAVLDNSGRTTTTP